MLDNYSRKHMGGLPGYCRWFDIQNFSAIKSQKKLNVTFKK